MSYSLSMNIVPGVAHQQNARAIEWTFKDLIAFGCQKTVVIARATTAQTVFCLKGHNQNISKICWSRNNYPINDNHSVNGKVSRLRLASSDTAGQLILWDVLCSKALSFFGTSADDPYKFVAEMSWLEWKDAGNTDLLLALHVPNANPVSWNFGQLSCLILWNAVEGTKIWTKSCQQNEFSLYTFSLNPFQANSIAFVTCDGRLILIDDLSVTKPPTFALPNLWQYSINHPDSRNAKRNQTVAGSFASVIVKAPLMKAIAATVSTAADRSSRILDTWNENLGISDAVSAGVNAFDHSQVSSSHQHMESVHSYSAPFDESFIELSFHPATRNYLLLVYKRSVLILDLSNDAYVVSQIVFDKSASALFSILPVSMRDAIYFVQENGVLSLRMQKYRQLYDSVRSNESCNESINVASRHDDEAEIVYDLACVSESLKITKNCKVIGCALCPATQRRLCLLLSSGKLLFYDLMPQPSCGFDADRFAIDSPFSRTLENLISLDKGWNHVALVKLRFVNRAITEALGNSLSVIRLCPEPSGPGQQLSAVGTADGCVQIVEIHSSQIKRIYCIHSCAVKCLEWVGPCRLISSATSQPSSTSAASYRNELYLTDVRTGFSKILRKSDDLDDSPIYLLRVSHFHCYLAIAFRDQQPLEIWDLMTFRLLRRMSRNCPIIIDVCWSTKHNNQNQINNDESTGQRHERIRQQMVYRENLVILDNENRLHHVVVKGLHVRDGKQVNTQWLSSSVVTCMAWRGELLVFGYADGRVSVWNLETKKTKASASAFSMNRGAVRRLCFPATDAANNSSYFLSLHTDGSLLLWRTLDLICCRQWGSPAPSAMQLQPCPHHKIVDADLLTGDGGIAVMITVDGCLVVEGDDLTSKPSHTNTVDSINRSYLEIGSAALPDKIITLIKVALLDRSIVPCYATEQSASSDLSICSFIQCLDIKENEKSMMVGFLSHALHDLEKFDNTDPRFASFLCRLLNDEWEANFWDLVKSVYKSDSSNNDDHHISACFDVYADNETFRALQLAKSRTFDQSRCNASQLKRHVNRLILLGAYDTAARCLLDGCTATATGSGASSDFYADCLKACLLGAASAKTTFDGGSVLKMAATNLIADGRLDEGVELLRLGAQPADACRYLQSFNKWDSAHWLAKLAFFRQSDYGLYVEIGRRFVDALANPPASRRMAALSLSLSVEPRNVNRIVDLLLSSKQSRLAALFTQFYEVIARHGVWMKTETDKVFNSSISIGSNDTTIDLPPEKFSSNGTDFSDEKLSDVSDLKNSLRDGLNLQYARTLFDLGLCKAARFYAQKCSTDVCIKMLREFDLLIVAD